MDVFQNHYETHHITPFVTPYIYIISINIILILSTYFLIVTDENASACGLCGDHFAS
jgi:hypothetical protein